VVRIEPDDTTGFLSIPSVSDIQDLDLGRNLDPSEVGVISALFNITISGIGAFMAAVLMGVAAIPAGVTLGIQNLITALRSFLVEFVGGFFMPFQVGAQCLNSGGGACSASIPGIQKAQAVAASGGLLGYASAIVMIGLMIYVLGKGVSALVG